MHEAILQDWPLICQFSLWHRSKEQKCRQGVILILSVQVSPLQNSSPELVSLAETSAFRVLSSLSPGEKQAQGGRCPALHRCTASPSSRVGKTQSRKQKLSNNTWCHPSHYPFLPLPWAEGLYLNPASSRFSTETAQGAAIPWGKQTCWLKVFTLLILSFCVCCTNLLNRNLSPLHLLGRSRWDILILCLFPSSAHLASC